MIRKLSRTTTRMLATLLAMFVAGGLWADFAKTNPVTGATENYTYKFVGTTTWNGTDYWQDSSGNNPTGVPGKQSDSTFDPFLFDGNTININAGMEVDGWTLRMGLYNGAYVSMNNLKKFQSGTMWVTVDETSKLRINNVNDKYEGDALNLYSARESGIEWTCALSGAQGTGLPFNYYLKGNGSVAFTTITAANCSHTIKQADVTLHGTTATGKGKRVNSKTLVSFTSSTQSFLADATIKVKYANGASCKDVALSSVTATTPTLTTAGDIGDCELVQTSTGIVLYYVDYVYTPSISLNFTDSGANLTTENDVGLAGYTAPGTAWNNIAAAVGTTSSTIKMIDATGTATVNSGISVQIATTRGSWNCSSLTAATDPRQGYIDEDSGDNTTPTITVSGIPFNNYRVIVYHATDNGDVKFGYDTINGTNLTYVDGALTTGTTAWGDTGDQNTSHPMEEGVNTLVSGVLSGSTATIVAHRGSGFRGCVAAVQIVEASNTSLEETGGYAADCSQIVFKNTTLAELTGDTLSARFGGDWSGTVKTFKMTFNNFDRSAEASGTITCQAQVQHDSNVKGVLLTFTQVGDDVAVKTTGGKYKTGTVGESIASATDATGHYAIYNFALPRKPLTDATIVWEPGEFEMTKVGSDGNSYSFSSFGGLSVNGDGNLQAGSSTSSSGATVDVSAMDTQAVTVLIKYSSLSNVAGINVAMASIKSSDDHDIIPVTTANNVLTVSGTHNTNNGSLFPFMDGNLAMQSGQGYFIFTYNNSTDNNVNGAYAYSGATLASSMAGGRNSSLKWTGTDKRISTVAVGGAVTVNKAVAWRNVVVERVAIFKGNLTPSDLANYYFPTGEANKEKYSKYRYAGSNIWTWKTPSTVTADDNIANNSVKYSVFDVNCGSDTAQTYTDGNTANDLAYWPYFCYTAVIAENSRRYTAPGRVLRFVKSDGYRTANINGKFGPLTLGGIIVEEGATGYSIQNPSGDSTARSLALGDPTGTAETWFEFDEDFTINRTSVNAFMGTMNFYVASGKALTVGKATKLAQTWNANSTGGNGYPTIATAGGTLKMHGEGHIDFTAGLTAEGSTLDFSDIGGRYNDTTPFLNGPLTISGDTKFVFPADIVLPYTYKVATSITVSSGTLAYDYTDANGNVYTVPLTVDTANGTVTVPALSNATVIEVNGALTISATTTADIVVNSTGTLTLATGSSLSGTVTGSGTIVCNQGVDLSGSGFGDSANWTGTVQVVGDATGPSTDHNKTVYGNANSTLEVSGLVYMSAVTSLPGVVNVASGATLFVANTELTSLSISGTNSGTITLSTATSLATLTLSDGIARGTINYPSSITTLNVSLTETIADDGEKSFTCTGASPTSGTLTLTRAGGTTDAPIAGTIDGSTVSFAWTPAVSGKACWIDYEMNYKSGVTTGFENSGSDTTDLHSDSGITGDDAFYNGMLYTYAHPWRDMTGDNAYPSSWTAVVRCTVPNYENAAIITFGTCNGGLIGLVAGADPETQMKLVKTTGNSAFTVLQTMTVQNATTAQHVYVFEVENKTTIKVYCDGDEVLNETFAAFTLGGGIQVGSVHGGIGNTGIIRFAKNESPANTLDETVQKNARIDCVRLFKGLLGTKAIRQLSVEFPAVKLYRATVAADDTTTWDDLDWSPEWDGGNEYSKIILTAEGDATLTLPSTITAEDFQIDVASGYELTLNRAAGGTTITTTNPMEINNGTMYLADDSSLGTWQIAGTGAVRLKNGAAVTGALSGTAKVAIASGDTVYVTPGGSIANPLTGAGTLSYQYTTAPDSALAFSSWTGTVQIPAIASSTEVNLNNYGVEGSTVGVLGISNGAWLSNAIVLPTVCLEGNMTLNSFSASYVNTINKLSGSGTFALAADGTAEGYADGYFLVKDVSTFAGSISVAAPGLAIGSAKPESPTTYGQIWLTTTATIAAGKTWTASGEGKGVVLGAAGATLTNTDGVLATKPTSFKPYYTIVEGSGAASSKVYSLSKKTGTIFAVY